MEKVTKFLNDLPILKVMVLAGVLCLVVSSFTGNNLVPGVILLIAAAIGYSNS